jgi:transposase-like protein
MIHPPHCPNPECRHYSKPRTHLWYRRIGFYTTKAFGVVPRFRCNTCGTGFSRQTFSIDYYAKKILPYRDIYNQINAGAGIRNIARQLGVKDQTVTNRINRMARNALLINQMMNAAIDLQEDLVIDGLQNFCVSQYFPDNYTIVVGKDSQFVYDCDYATLRRGGRMTMKQKIRRSRLEKIYKPSPRAVKHSFQRLLEGIGRYRRGRTVPLILYTDEKSDYRRAFWKGTDRIRERMFSGQWRHHMTNSREGRNQKNPLFAVNYIDREIRKDMASQTRETVQFPRNVANAMLRMNLYFFDHNVYKPYRIRQPSGVDERHADRTGLARTSLVAMTSGLLEKRVFRPGALVLSESAKRTLNREWVTPLKSGKERCWRYLRA